MIALTGIALTGIAMLAGCSQAAHPAADTTPPIAGGPPSSAVGGTQLGSGGEGAVRGSAASTSLVPSTTLAAAEPPSPGGGQTSEAAGAAASDTPQGIDATLACIRRWESGGDYTAVSPDGLYRGAYQFLPSTWAGAVARAGFPEWSSRPASDAPPAVQNAAAAQLYAERGLSPWPTPAERCA